MKCLCEKDYGLCSAHATSQHVFGCPSWGMSSKSEVQQQTSMSKSLSLKIDALPQKGHNSKALSFQFQEQVSSSNQSTDSSQSGHIPFQHSSSTGQNLTIHPPPVDHGQSLAHFALPFADPYSTGLHSASYATQYKLMEAATFRIPLPSDMTEEPIYVNSKQYHAILRRRQCRAKLEAHNKLIKDRKPYLHESRHVHALKRARGAGGRFLNVKQLHESNPDSQNHDQNHVSTSYTCLNLNANMTESIMHDASNRNEMFHQQEELEFRLCSYPSSQTGRNMQDYMADKNVGVNQRRLSVRM